jgi:uncharacterized protein YdeI (BOF family)
MRKFFITTVCLLCVSGALTACGGGFDGDLNPDPSQARSLEIQMMGSTDADVSAEKNPHTDTASADV